MRHKEAGPVRERAPARGRFQGRTCAPENLSPRKERVEILLNFFRHSIQNKCTVFSCYAGYMEASEELNAHVRRFRSTVASLSEHDALSKTLKKIRSIQGFLDFVDRFYSSSYRARGWPDKDCETFEWALASSRSETGMLADMLEGKQHSLVVEDVNIASLAVKLGDAFGGVRYSGPTELLAHANRGSLFTLLENIFSNAFRACEENGVEPDVRVSANVTNNGDGAPESVSVSVSDNGIGLTEEQKNEAFKSQFTTKTVERGEVHGMGLLQCASIVRMHRGTISVESHRGSGTTVTFSLPLNQESALLPFF